MNIHLQTIIDFLQEIEYKTAEEKEALLKAAKKVKSDLEISEFKLERTEKVKRTTAILLEETIEELEQKRKSVEQQNRELEIESALERVRTVAMGMHKPDDLLNICEILFKELQLLGFTELRNAIIQTFVDENKYLNDYDFSDVTGGWISRIPYTGHPVIEKFIQNIRKNNDAFVETVVTGPELEDWKAFRKANGEVDDPRLLSIRELFYYHYSVGEGDIGISTFSAISTEKQNLLKRFRNVFDLAYKRYIDITKAEAQAREAQIEASLERVRSRTMSMQKSDELAETAAVLFNQLIQLGIEPNRLYIAIVKAENGEAEFYITAEDGSQVSMAYKDNLNNNPSFKKMLDGWKQEKKSLLIDMKGPELEQYFKHLSSIHVTFKGGLTQKRRIQYLSYFSKGFIGMASPDEQPEETLILLQRFAAVFNLTFTRFNDLKIAEAHALQAERDLIEIKTSRKNAEEALLELQATQTQLVQSEKMASLGELTAGIAHEIQNPLNFVNNFSEVSKELLDEMKEEIEKGNYDEVKEIAADLIQNLVKINHHGKRADAIVKGMLQHSRSSTGQKELTDINALTDEYLRLAFHGLRAKDKTFNAALKTDFDESIGLIKIMPQDMGRVILNLITNAFYAVTERNKLKAQGYEPVVSIATKRNGSTIQIQVTDNGNGIPQNIIDKIFQPFFTTKPTGQGTGLGLSLAYDIIKAHGGALKVDTKEGEGSTFIIQLPA